MSSSVISRNGGQAKHENAKLVIARLDRFSRRVSLIASIRTRHWVELRNATDFQRRIFRALPGGVSADSDRTKTASAEAKRRGKTLGSNGRNLAVRNRKAADEFATLFKAKLDADHCGDLATRSLDI